MMNNTERHAIRLWLLAGDARPIMTIAQRRSKGPSEPVLRWSCWLPSSGRDSTRRRVKNPSLGRALPQAMLDVFYDAVESLVLELEDLNPGMSQTALERTAMESDCANPERFQTIHDTGRRMPPIGTRWGHGVFSLRP